MSARSLALVLGAAVLAAQTTSAPAQVLRELDPIELEYVILHGDPLVSVGQARVSFRPAETPRGRRLEVKSRIEYEIPRKTTPFAYEEEATLTCDREGVSRFETSAKALGDERKNTAIRVGSNYQVTTTFQGKRRSYTITSGVQRTNFGLFAGAFLAEPLDQGELFADYPILYPVGGDHQPRRRFREAILPTEIAQGRIVPAILTRFEKLDKSSDRIWNAETGHQILLRMEESSSLGTLVYELRRVNGEPVAESKLLR